MTRRVRCTWTFLALLGAGALPAVQGSEVIPQQTALRHGLTRGWVSRVEIDPSRGRVEHVILHDGLLLVQTTRATIHAFDAETGETLWVAHVGNADYPTTPAALNGRAVAVVNGSRLYVLSRDRGHVLGEREVDGAPSAGVAMSSSRIFVPVMTGGVLSYPVPSDPRRVRIPSEPPEEQPETDSAEPEASAADETAGATSEAKETSARIVRLRPETMPPRRYHGKGMAMAAPSVAHSVVAWGTDQGMLYSANQATMSGNFRYKSQAAIVAPVAYSPPHVVAASRDGYVFALHERLGTVVWRFPAGSAVSHAPVLAGDALYVIPEDGGMFRLNVATGKEVWSAYGIMQLVSLSPDKVYGSNLRGDLVALDAATGARLDVLPMPGIDWRLTNLETDRIYAGTSTGLVQCLHETALVRPVPVPAVAGGDAAPAAEAPAAEADEEPQADSDDPFAMPEGEAVQDVDDDEE